MKVLVTKTEDIEITSEQQLKSLITGCWNRAISQGEYELFIPEDGNKDGYMRLAYMDGDMYSYISIKQGDWLLSKRTKGELHLILKKYVYDKCTVQGRD